MSGYGLHPGAFADLEEIREYIARENPDAADRIIAELFDTFEMLSSFPEAGHVRPDLTARPLRLYVARSYVIAYAPEERPLWIIAVLHGRRNPRLIASILSSRHSSA